MSAELIKDTLRMTSVKELPQLQILIEEDILVPDVKPDLAKIIVSDGKVKLLEKENYAGSLRIGGDLMLGLVYVPEERHLTEAGEGLPIDTMESKIGFKYDAEYTCGNPGNIEIKPVVESMHFTVINERKFRVNAVIALNIREYEDISKNMLGVNAGDDLQILKRQIRFTDIMQRKKEYMDIKEDIELKEGLPEIGKVLKCEMSLAETHRQITNEKAVISGNLFYNILYMSDDMESKPVFFQAKSDFTQFIRVDGGENVAGSKVDFTIDSLKIEPKKDDNDNMVIFDVTADITTNLELYKNREYEIAVDAYHGQKDIDLEKEEMSFTHHIGQGSVEASIREIITVPSDYENIGEVIGISGKAFEISNSVEKDRNIVEGMMNIEVLYLSADNRRGVYGFSEEIPFRNFVEIAGISKDNNVENEFIVKEIWFDRINDRQIEVNVGIAIKSAAYRDDVYEVISNAVLSESQGAAADAPHIILYIARDGDKLWDIAKRYKTTQDEIMRANDMDEEQDLFSGRKLLILR